MKQWFIGGLVGVAVLFSGCTWVKPAPKSETVRVVAVAEPTCEKLGTVIVSVAAKVGPYERSEEKVQENLTTLARNAVAADYKNADTIAPVAGIQDGQQTFAVYKCVKP